MYSLLGPAADKGLFTVGRKTGYVRIHGILDREETPFYEVSVSSASHVLVGCITNALFTFKTALKLTTSNNKSVIIHFCYCVVFLL